MFWVWFDFVVGVGLLRVVCFVLLAWYFRFDLGCCVLVAVIRQAVWLLFWCSCFLTFRG